MMMIASAIRPQTTAIGTELQEIGKPQHLKRNVRQRHHEKTKSPIALG